MTRKRLAVLINRVYKGGTERKFGPAVKASEEIWSALKPAKKPSRTEKQ